jgi:hypothetical protein
MAREFKTSAAHRQQVHMIIGMVAPSGGGKTWSALELATGMQTVTGGDIEMIDTEHERGLFYAENFKFNHTPFSAPFASLDYLAAIQQAAKRAKIIIVDSQSHEHESEGGMIDYQEAELTRMAGDDPRRRQSMQMLAWAKPKAARRKLLQGLTQIDAHIIMCFRAKNTSKPGKDKDGKSIVVPMGFVPIAGEEFVFESALSMLFHPNARGVPTWNPDMPGERIAVKLPAQFAWLAEKSGPITRQDGERLAKWAKGDTKATAPPPAERFEAADSATGEISRAISAEHSSDYADLLEFEVDQAEDAASTARVINAAMKTDDWKQLREANPSRAAELKTKANDKVAEFKQAVAA